MKTALHIWITALIIQPIIFIFIIGELAIFVVPVEIIGSIPGLVLFWIATQVIKTSKMRIELKWILLLLTAILTALFCNYLFILQGNGGSMDSESLLIMMPAPIAAVMAVIINSNSVNRLFITTEDAHQKPYNPDNMDYQNDLSS